MLAPQVSRKKERKKGSGRCRWVNSPRKRTYEGSRSKGRDLPLDHPSAPAHPPIVDHPTQLVCIWIFICWVGGGDPCGAAELCISGPWNQKKRARTHVFLKYPCHVHEDWLDGKIGTKHWVRPPKKPVCFMSVSKFLKWGIPQNRNFQNEGSLKMEISKTRDCSSRWTTDGADCSCVKSDL